MIVLWIILGILLFVLLFAVCVLFSKTKVYISYKNDELKVKLRNGLIRYTIKNTDKESKKKEEPTKESISDNVEKTKHKLSDKKSFVWTLLKEMRYKIEVVKVKISVKYGTGDPADTGFLYGVIWAAIGNLYQLFNRYLVFDFPETIIEPDFENKVFTGEFESIIKVKLVHIIIALAKGNMPKK